jgi:small subunit ribosomal protein S20
MPRIKSSRKRLRQTRSRTSRNRAARHALRTAVKKVRTAPSADDARAALRAAEAELDRAGRKRLVHPNLAARTKRRLARMARGKS